MGFVYEHISVDQRVTVGLLATLCRGSYGLVSELARGLGTSRQFIYRLAARVPPAVARALAPGTPGPNPTPPARAEPPPGVDRRRLDRAIVTLALVGHASQRAIGACLDELYGVRPSLGYVNGVLARASRAAAAANAELEGALPAAAVTALAADELFVRGQAHLVAVAPDSLLLLALAHAEHADAAAWQAVFTHLTQLPGGGVRLQRVATDGGQALACAVGRLPAPAPGSGGVAHQLDRWHALRQIGRAEGALARSAYAAIGKEYALARQALRLPHSRSIGGYVWQRYEEAQQRAAQAIRQYDDLCTVGQWAREALESLDPRTGRARSQAECLAELGAVTALLRALGGRTAERLAAYLDDAGPGLLRYADDLQAQLATVARAYGARGEAGVRCLGREWLLGRAVAGTRPSERAPRRLAYARAHLAALLHWGAEYAAARAQVVAVLDRVLRGSSLAECVNSWLRPYADLLKGLGARLLPLFQLYRNARIFARGKRAGASPLALAGVRLPDGDWLTLLGLGRPDRPGLGQAPARSVRSLPQAA